MSGSELREKRKELNLSQAKLAELTDISQHQISAFELEKKNLSDMEIDKIQKLLADQQRVEKISNRKKRYRTHEHAAVEHLPDRIRKCQQTSGNEDYLNLINNMGTNQYDEENKYKALSLFSGCGGFSLGFKWAGFEIKGFVEKKW